MSQPETKCWRNDAVAKVTGKAKFTDDLKFANVLHAAPAYSDYVHAPCSFSPAKSAKASSSTGGSM